MFLLKSICKCNLKRKSIVRAKIMGTVNGKARFSVALCLQMPGTWLVQVLSCSESREAVWDVEDFFIFPQLHDYSDLLSQ